MKIEFEVFKCGQYDDTLHTKEEVLEKVEAWLDEEEVEEDDGPLPLYNVLNTIKIKKIGKASFWEEVEE